MTTASNPVLDFNNLEPYQNRQFIPINANLSEYQTVTTFYQTLLKKDIKSAADLENWLLERSELEAALDQTSSILYIRMTCQTDDEERAKAYQYFIEKIVPAIKPLEHELNLKFLAACEKYLLNAQRYQVYLRSVKTDVELFVQDNVPLQTQVDLLSQEYQTISGAMTVHFEGKEQTMPMMGKYLLEPNRELREKAWRAIASRRLMDRGKLDEIFDKMLSLRNQVAKNAKFPNYVEYRFRALHRFDYTPKDCKEYHKTIREIVLPLWKKILEKRRADMKLKELRPWDTGVDPLGRNPLKPFTEVSDLIEKCKSIFKSVDSTLGAQFCEMADQGLLDLASRKGKAPGGYQSTLNEARRPFIFMNAVGVDDDVRTLLHEGGHAFHALACRQDPLVAYRHAPMEFCEVASMGMELLAGEHLSVFYKDEDYKRSVLEHLEGIIYILVWVAIIDSFQHWIYEHPTHSALERKEAWIKTYKSFETGVVNWDGLEEEMSYLWHRQLHIFEVPFYYIEYGIAQLGALQLWLNAQKNSAKAIREYRQGLSLGGSEPLPKLFEAAGLKFDFSASTIKPLVEAVQKAINKLS